MPELPLSTDSPNTGPQRGGRLREIAWLFLRLGATSFGGPAAHIALMETEIVRRRAWLTPAEFLDLVGATNLIPGPSSTELAIHIGWRRAGWAGLLVAGTCFIAPAALIVLAVAWAYERYGSAPLAVGLLDGIKPVVLAIVAQALARLGRAALKTRLLLGSALVAGALLAAGVNELAVLFGTGTLVALAGEARRRPQAALLAAGAPPLLPFALPAATRWGAETGPVSLGALFLVFAKVGSVLFGSGYVLIAFLRADLVERRGWLTEAQLLDAVAVGQVTPGPVFTTATFVGYVLRGLPGAAVATVGIFAPAFAFVALSGPLLPRLRSSRPASAFLDGLNAASVALMAVVSSQLAPAALARPAQWVLGLSSLALLLGTRISSLWLVVAGGLLGILRTFYFAP